MYFFDLHKNFANENIFKEIFFLSCEKMLGDGQVAIKYKMRSGTIYMAAGTNSKVRKVHMFGVDFREKHLFGIASIVVIEKPKFYI